MEHFKTKEELIESLKDLLAIEKSSNNDYKKLLSLFTNSIILKKINGIKKDKEKHILILEKLIED